MILNRPNGLCYVSYVSSSVIHLEGATRPWRAYLRAAGLQASWWSGGVDYARQHEQDESGCEQAMIALARLGVCFAEDYKQGMAPADIMRDLMHRGVLRAPFTAISWSGKGGARKRVVHPPEAE